jgi:hypothetical protein
MVIEVATQAAPPETLRSVPIVLGTVYGEMQTQLALLQALCRDGEVSPTRFHSSVYNTAVGYLSIATNNRGFSTTVAAGLDTAAMAFVEGLTWLKERGGAVMVILADETPTSPFISWPMTSLATAFLLTSERPSGACFGQLRNLRRGSVPGSPPLPPELHRNAAGWALPVHGALKRQGWGPVVLAPGKDAGWLIEVVPVEATS